MIPKSLEKFMKDLLEATGNSKVRWAEGASREAYFCTRNGYNLHLSYWFDEDEVIGYYHFNITGKKSASFSVASHESDYNFMNNLYSSVTVNAADLGEISEEFFD